MNAWVIILFFCSAIGFGISHLRFHFKLVELLVRHGRKPVPGLSTWAVYYNIKDAQKLVKELGNNPEAVELKNTLRKTDVSLFLTITVPLLTAVLWMVMSAKQ